MSVAEQILAAEESARLGTDLVFHPGIWADHTSPFTDILAAGAATGKTVRVAGGSYTFTGEVPVPSNVHLILDDSAVFTYTGSATTGFLYATGTQDTGIALTADTTLDGGMLNLGTGATALAYIAALSDGDQIRVTSHAQFDLSNTSIGGLDQQVGEMAFVSKPTGNTLYAAIDNSQLTLVVAGDQDARTPGLPYSGTLLIGSEQITYSSWRGGSGQFTFTLTARGANGTTAAAHASGDTVTIPDGMLALKASLAGGPYYVGANPNGATSTLNGAINASTTSITLRSPLIQAPTGVIKIGTELIYYSGINSTTYALSGVVRGYNGTTAASHADNAAATQVDAAYIQKVTPAHDIVIEGRGQINAPAANFTQALTGLKTDMARNVIVRGLRFNNWAGCSVELSDTLDSETERLTVVSEKSTTGTHYGVDVTNASQDCRVTRCTFRGMRHAVTTGGVTARGGIVRRLSATDCTAYGTTASAFDTHAGSIDVHYVNCRAFYPQDAGFNLRAPRGSIDGGLVHAARGYGVYLSNESSVGTDWLITGLRIYDNLGTYAFFHYGNDQGVAAALAADITNSATSLTLDAGNFSISDYVTIDNESIIFTGIDTGTNSLTGCIRGALGTTAATHSSGARAVRGAAGATLASGIDASQTTIPLSSVSGMTIRDYVTIDNETVQYTGVSGTTVSGLTRGALGTTAAAHTAGATVAQGAATNTDVRGLVIDDLIIDSPLNSGMYFYSPTTFYLPKISVSNTIINNPGRGSSAHTYVGLQARRVDSLSLNNVRVTGLAGAGQGFSLTDVKNLRGSNSFAQASSTDTTRGWVFATGCVSPTLIGCGARSCQYGVYEGAGGQSGLRMFAMDLSTCTTPRSISSAYSELDVSGGSLVINGSTVNAIARTQALLTARGLLTETLPKNTLVNHDAPTQGRIYAGTVYLFAGEVVTSLVACIITSAAGTAPTLMKLGLQDSSNTIVAVTGNVASGTWTAGERAFALSSPYTIPTSGWYRILVLQSGAFGTTQPTLLRGSTTGFSGSYAPLSGKPTTFDVAAAAGESYTDLPSVSSTLSMTGGGTNARAYWLAAA